APMWVSRIRARRRAGSATMASCRIRAELRALHRSADQPRSWLEPSPVRLALQLDLTRLFAVEARSRRPGGLLAFVDAPGWASPRHSVRGMKSSEMEVSLALRRCDGRRHPPDSTSPVRAKERLRAFRGCPRCRQMRRLCGAGHASPFCTCARRNCGPDRCARPAPRPDRAQHRIELPVGSAMRPKPAKSAEARARLYREIPPSRLAFAPMQAQRVARPGPGRLDRPQ